MKDITKIYQLKGLKPKNKDHTNFYDCCDLTQKVYLIVHVQAYRAVRPLHNHPMKANESKNVEKLLNLTDQELGSSSDKKKYLTHASLSTKISLKWVICSLMKANIPIMNVDIELFIYNLVD